MGVIILIIFFVVGIFIATKIAELKTRAREHLLKGTGFSYSEINGKIDNSMDETKAKKFLAAHPEYTLESIKELIKNFAIKIINKTEIKEFSPKLVEKMQSDSKIDKLAKMEFKRVNIGAANTNFLSGIVTYSDGRDEYCLGIDINYSENKLTILRYYIYRGAEIGF